jgi:hypothetical protein
MKRISLVLSLIALTTSASFATAYTHKSKAKVKISKKVLSRQCCTVSATWNEDGGSSHSVTACAGWFLSNNENAYERACEKARKALNAVQ